MKIKAIVSLNNDYEFKSKPFSSPVKPIEWEKRKITFIQLATSDLAPVDVAKLTKAVDFIATQVRLKNSVYVHCTAGVGRSVSVAICALVHIKNWTLEQAMDHIKVCRPQFVLSVNQMQTIRSWYCRESSTRRLIE